VNLATSVPHDYLIRTVRAGVIATWITLASLVAYLFLADDGTIDEPLYLAMLVAAGAGVVVAGFLPWDSLFLTKAGMRYMYAWSILDIVLITIAISATGESMSPLFVLFALTTVFFSTAYPPAAQVALLLFTYACVLFAALLWDSPLVWGPLITRMALIGAITYLTSFLAQELIRRYNELSLKVDEHRRAEEALRRSEGQLEEAQRIARVGSWEWDMVSGKLAWSDELYRLYQRDPATFEPSFEGFLDAIDPDDRERADAAVKQALIDHEPIAFEHRVPQPDGSTRTLMGRGRVQCDDEGRPVKMVGTGQDITDLKRAEATARALAELERRQQEALELNDSIVQGLAVAKYSLDLEHTQRAAHAVEESLKAAKAFVGDLLRTSEEATDLVREQPADVGVGVPPPPQRRAG
jgi:PAS domain-containing protein